MALLLGAYHFKQQHGDPFEILLVALAANGNAVAPLAPCGS